MIRYAQTAHAFGKSKVATRDQTHRELVDRSLQFHERSQDFIGTHDESFSVTMRVHDPDRSPFKIQRLGKSPSFMTTAR
jgi:hypothetical protein